MLPQVDCLFINDYEATHATGIAVRERGHLNHDAVEAAARLLHLAGARLVVFHAPEGAFSVGEKEPGTWQPSLRIDASEMRGAAGAGDAFAAGFLLGWHERWSVSRCLRLAVATAATSLFHPTCSDGVRPLADCFRLADERGQPAD